MPKLLILVYISIVHGVGGTEVGGVMVAVFGMGGPFVFFRSRPWGRSYRVGGESEIWCKFWIFACGVVGPFQAMLDTCLTSHVLDHLTASLATSLTYVRHWRRVWP
jgi:hypothetical protein